MDSTNPYRVENLCITETCPLVIKDEWLRQQSRDVWSFLEQAWIAHRLGGVMPSLVTDR
jgi:hypothetical protein